MFRAQRIAAASPSLRRGDIGGSLPLPACTTRSTAGRPGRLHIFCPHTGRTGTVAPCRLGHRDGGRDRPAQGTAMRPVPLPAMKPHPCREHPDARQLRRKHAATIPTGQVSVTARLWTPQRPQEADLVGAGGISSGRCCHALELAGRRVLPWNRGRERLKRPCSPTIRPVDAGASPATAVRAVVNTLPPTRRQVGQMGLSEHPPAEFDLNYGPPASRIPGRSRRHFQARPGQVVMLYRRRWPAPRCWTWRRCAVARLG